MSVGSFNQTVEIDMKKMILAVAVLAASGSTFAEGVYMGVSYGNTDVDTGVSGLTWTARLDEDDNGWKIYAGMDINENVFVEAQYADLGEASLTGNNGDRFTADGTQYVFTANNVSIKADATSLGASVGYKIPTASGFTPFAKIGLQRWESDTTVAAGGGGYTDNDDGTDLFYGAGVSYNVNESIAIRAEFERYDIDSEDVDFLSAGISVKF